MRDVIIAVIILAVLVAIFSCCDAPTQQDPPPATESPRGEGSRESGESDIVMPGKGDPPVESPKTGYHF